MGKRHRNLVEIQLLWLSNHDPPARKITVVVIRCDLGVLAIIDAEPTDLKLETLNRFCIEVKVLEKEVRLKVAGTPTGIVPSPCESWPGKKPHVHRVFGLR